LTAAGHSAASQVSGARPSPAGPGFTASCP
jgi:hypothetical protein